MNHAEKVKSLVARFLPPVDEGSEDAKVMWEFRSAIDEMQAEIEGLSKDAARYRWLRSNPQWLGWEHDFRPDEVESEVDKAMPESQARGDKT